MRTQTMTITKTLTRKGKNVVRRSGKIWRILEKRESVQCLGGAAGFRIVSDLTGDMRWVACTSDVNFEFLTDDGSGLTT
jgi:hypothetical protein